MEIRKPSAIAEADRNMARTKRDASFIVDIMRQAPSVVKWKNGVVARGAGLILNAGKAERQRRRG